MSSIKDFKMIIVVIIVVFGLYFLYEYLGNKGTAGHESNSSMQPQYKNTNDIYNNTVQPSSGLGSSEDYANANGTQTTIPSMPASCSNSAIQNPAELLPKDTNSQWAQLNPSGKGELANVQLLKAGYHIGIDTVGQTLRNANLQIRSEPPNPQLNVGPWNQSTIEHDFMRPPMEIGSGPQ